MYFQGQSLSEDVLSRIQSGDLPVTFESSDQPEGCHTDGDVVFRDARPDYFFLCCEMACPNGGASFVVDAEALLSTMPPDDISALTDIPVVGRAPESWYVQHIPLAYNYVLIL